MFLYSFGFGGVFPCLLHIDSLETVCSNPKITLPKNCRSSHLSSVSFPKGNSSSNQPQCFRCELLFPGRVAMGSQRKQSPTQLFKGFPQVPLVAMFNLSKFVPSDEVKLHFFPKMFHDVFPYMSVFPVNDHHFIRLGVSTT